MALPFLAFLAIPIEELSGLSIACYYSNSFSLQNFVQDFRRGVGSSFILPKMKTRSGLRLTNFRETLNKVGVFGRGLWRYWRLGEPVPESNYIVQKLYAYTDGRSNDILFRILESKRKEADLRFGWDGASLVSRDGIFDPSIEGVVRTLREDGVVVIPLRLKKETVQNLYELALSCQLDTSTYAPVATDYVPGTQTTIPMADTGTSNGIDPSQPRYSLYTVPRSLLLPHLCTAFEPLGNS